MERNKDMKNKKTLVVGLGKSGIAAAEVLIGLGADVAVYDKKAEEQWDPRLVDFYKKNQVRCYFDQEPEDMASFELLVVSPGVPLEINMIRSAQTAGTEIIGEVELAYRVGKGTYVAITGTNGKTTTTTLTGEIFRYSGRKTEVVGNVGVAVAQKALKADEDTWFVTEISSFQLETTKEFHPRVSALLNITPDHMDRHHTMENYAKAKAMIYQNQTADDFFIVNRDDPASFALAEVCPATVVPFSRKEILDFGCFVKDGEIVICDGKSPEKRICKVAELQIPGGHNLENALAAAAIAYFSRIQVASIAQVLRDFQGVEHRLEFVAEVKGVRFVNDSKGTNPDASIKALEAIETPILLIAGGYDKNSSFEELMAVAKGRVKAFVLLGKTAPKVREAASNAGFDNIIMARDMEECVKEAFRIAEKGDTVLLSPACASWDMYTCFEERGEDFRNRVKALGK